MRLLLIHAKTPLNPNILFQLNAIKFGAFSQENTISIIVNNNTVIKIFTYYFY